jgi:hypothetical protein
LGRSIKTSLIKTMDEQLKETHDMQRVWSCTADALKARHERARAACFLLSIAAALLAAFASQLPDLKSGQPAGAWRLWFAIVSAIFVGLVGFLSTRFLNSQNSLAWIRARAASEALKRLAFTYAAQAAPYVSQTSGVDSKTLAKDRAAVEHLVEDLTKDQTSPTKASGVPTDFIQPDDYIARRVRGQKSYYERAALKAQSQAKLLRKIEFSLSLVATVLTALVGVLGKAMVAGLPFDLVALTGVLTTLSGAIVAFIEASRYDYVVTSYRSAARQLGELLASAASKHYAPSLAWSNFVGDVESILATENNAWLAKATKSH